MNHTQNTVAKITKIYAKVNFAACILAFFVLAITYDMNIAVAIIWIATSVVINFGIYIIGEVIQLLDDIKQNTSGKAQVAEAESNAAKVSNELPEL